MFEQNIKIEMQKRNKK